MLLQMRHQHHHLTALWSGQTHNGLGVSACKSMKGISSILYPTLCRSFLVHCTQIYQMRFASAHAAPFSS
jgi:hypothetical protein